MMPLAKRHIAPCLAVGSFYLLLIFGASLFLPNGAQAQMRLMPDCELQPGLPENCVHVVGCIDDQDLFVGRAHGWDTGTLELQMSSGVACVGVWDSFEREANFVCDDGTEGLVRYFHIDSTTGTTVGGGSTRDGRVVQGWSGHRVLEFLRGTTDEVVMDCGPTQLLLGNVRPLPESPRG